MSRDLNEERSWPYLGLGGCILGTGKDSYEAMIDVFEKWTEGSYGWSLKSLGERESRQKDP